MAYTPSYTADSSVAKRMFTNPASVASNQVQVGGVVYTKDSSGNFVKAGSSGSSVPTPSTPAVTPSTAPVAPVVATTPGSTVNNPAPAYMGYNAPAYPTAPSQSQGRDLNREQTAIQKYGGGDANKIANVDLKKIMEATYTKAELANIPDYKYLVERDAANQNFQKAQDTGQIVPPTSSMMATLENALRTKGDIGNQKLGQSEVFNTLGLDPYINLANSLNAHSQEMKQKYESFSTAMSTVGTQLSDSYAGALQTYKANLDRYDKEVASIQKTIADQSDFDQQMQILEKQNQNALALEALRQKNPSIAEQMAADTGGFDIVGGQIVPKAGDSTWILPENPTMRTDRNFNPLAIKSYAPTVKALKDFGLQEGVDFTLGETKNNSLRGVDDDGSEKVYTITFNNADAGVRGGVAALKAGQMNSWYANPKYSGASQVKSFLSQLSGTQVSNSSQAQEVFNAMPLDRQSQVVGFIYKNTEGGKGSFGTASNSGSGDKYDKAVEAILTPGSDARLTSYTAQKGFDKTILIERLSKKKAELRKNGDIAGMMRASAGGRPPEPTQIADIARAENVKAQLADIKAEITKMDTGPIMGIIRKNNPYDGKAKEIMAKLTAITPSLSRGIYQEKGILTDQDIKTYMATLPSLTNTAEQKKLLIAMTERVVEISLMNTFDSLARGEVDVSGYADKFDDISPSGSSPSAAAANATKLGLGDNFNPFSLIQDITKQ